MIRSEVDDIDFAAGEVVLREKKRNREKNLTYRRAAMTDLLYEAMQEWLDNGHPGGPYTFCRGEVTVHRKRKNAAADPAQAQLAKSDATHYFNHALAGSKWEVVRGFQFSGTRSASNLAREGVDQREIDEVLGHQTEDMRRRYRHFFPEQRENAVKKIFKTASRHAERTAPNA